MVQTKNRSSKKWHKEDRRGNIIATNLESKQSMIYNFFELKAGNMYSALLVLINSPALLEENTIGELTVQKHSSLENCDGNRYKDLWYQKT